MEPQAGAPWPLFSIIGGKLTTCRSLAEEAADRLLATLGRVRTASSRDRPLPGGEKSTDVQGGPRVIGTDLAVATARRAIESQWVTRLNDLVERRLMLLYDPRLSTAALRELAGLLVEAGKLGADSIEAEVQRTVERLRTHFGKHVPSEPAR
jgi:glycerol-3-phosphate dehydrogenase